MRLSNVLILAAALGVGATMSAMPAAATGKNEALDMCAKREAAGKGRCNAYGLGTTLDTVIICVDNSSTGHGTQCVRCQGSSPCTVIERKGPGSKKRLLGDTDAISVLTNTAPSVAPGQSKPKGPKDAPAVVPSQ